MSQNSQMHLRDVVVSSRGSKSAQLILENGGAVTHLFPEYTISPFGGPSSYDKDPTAARLNLDVHVNDETMHFFEQLDSWALSYLLEHSQRLFKKELTDASITERYKSLLRPSDKYPTVLRMKINLAGPRACRFWNAQGEQIEPPQDWKGLSFKPKVIIPHFWIMSDFGFLCNVTDILLGEAPTIESPFGIAA